jgi:hypothetical protein
MALKTDRRYMSMAHCGITITDKNESARRKNFPSSIVPTTSSADTGRRSNAGFRGRSPELTCFWWSFTQWRCWLLRLYTFGDRWKNEYWAKLNLYWQRKTELLTRYHFVHEKYRMHLPGNDSGRPRDERQTIDRLSHDTTPNIFLIFFVRMESCWPKISEHSRKSYFSYSKVTVLWLVVSFSL